MAGHIDKVGTKQHVEDTLEYTLDVKAAMAKAIVDDPMALQVQVAQDVGEYASHSYIFLDYFQVQACACTPCKSVSIRSRAALTWLHRPVIA
jgi:hypothetical protein